MFSLAIAWHSGIDNARLCLAAMPARPAFYSLHLPSRKWHSPSVCQTDSLPPVYSTEQTMVAVPRWCPAFPPPPLPMVQQNRLRQASLASSIQSLLICFLYSRVCLAVPAGVASYWQCSTLQIGCSSTQAHVQGATLCGASLALPLRPGVYFPGPCRARSCLAPAPSPTSLSQRS